MSTAAPTHRLLKKHFRASVRPEVVKIDGRDHTIHHGEHQIFKKGELITPTDAELAAFPKNFQKLDDGNAEAANAPFANLPEAELKAVIKMAEGELLDQIEIQENERKPKPRRKVLDAIDSRRKALQEAA